MDRYQDYGYTDAAQSGAHNYLLEPVVKAVKRWAPKRVLDAGCGNGSVARRLLPHAGEVFGFDMSESGVAQARRHLGDDKASVASVYDDWRDVFDGVDGFDAVVSLEVVEHLYDPRAFAARSFEALRPGGHLLLSTPYHGYLKNLAMAVTGTMDNHFTALWDGGHIKFWSRETLTQLLSEAGFRVGRFSGAGRLPYLWKSMILTATKPGV